MDIDNGGYESGQKPLTELVAEFSTPIEHIWIVTGHSESGDSYIPLAFTKKPTKKLLKKIAFSLDGDEDNPTGCGDYGSYVYLEVEKVKLDTIK